MLSVVLGAILVVFMATLAAIFILASGPRDGDNATVGATLFILIITSLFITTLEFYPYVKKSVRLEAELKGVQQECIRRGIAEMASETVVIHSGRFKFKEYIGEVHGN